MIDQSQNSKLAALAEHGGTAVNQALRMAKLGVLVVSVAAAVPTAQNLYYAWKTGVPFNQVQHRLTQAALWEKNFDCKIDYRALSTSSSSKVEVGSCGKTGDISIRVSSGKDQVNYEWIAYEQLPKPATQAAGLLDLFIASAYADETKPVAGAAQAAPMPAPVRVAQAGMEVVCQTKAKDAVVRIVKDAGKCFRETVSLFKGTVEKREEVPCTTQCN
ncbi:MAG: hypothetical protein ABL907_04550 [Hyphomicrobium sp.]